MDGAVELLECMRDKPAEMDGAVQFLDDIRLRGDVSGSLRVNPSHIWIGGASASARFSKTSLRFSPAR
jgi:cytoskeletal protein CcmA (bactofilin family)